MKKQSKPPNIRHTSRKITCHYPTSKTKLLNSATEIGKIKKIQSQKEMRHSLNDTAWEIVWESSGSQPISLGYRSTQVFMRNTFLASFSSSSNWFLSIWILYWSWIVFSLMCSANLSASVISSWNQTQNQKKIYFTAGQSFPQNTLSHWKSIQKETELCSKAGWPWQTLDTPPQQHRHSQQCGEAIFFLPCFSYLQLQQTPLICLKHLFLCHLKPLDILQVAQLPWRHL